MAERRLSRSQMVKGFNKMLQDTISGVKERRSMSEVETEFRVQVQAGEEPTYGGQMADSLIESFDAAK